MTCVTLFCPWNDLNAPTRVAYANRRGRRSGNKSVHTLRGLYNDTCTPTEPYLEDDILSHGLYSLTIDEYLKHFDREQLHVGFHEQFVSEPSTFIGQIEDHMGVPRHDFKVRSQGLTNSPSASSANRVSSSVVLSVEHFCGARADAPGEWFLGVRQRFCAEQSSFAR